MSLTPAAPAAASVVVTSAAVAARIEIVRSTATAPADRVGLGCASHCCSGTAGVTCCAAALVPEIANAPAFAGSGAFLLGRASALLGLPPEARPKPPKSFA